MRRRLYNNEVIEYFEGTATTGSLFYITYTHNNTVYNKSVIPNSSTGFFSFEIPQSVTSFGINDNSRSRLLTVTQMPSLQNCTDFTRLFHLCENLTSINLSNLITKQVTNFNWMFHTCSSLTSIDVSNFDTSNATDLDSLFAGCSGLKSIDVSNFKTSKVTTLRYLFNDCSSLTTLNLSNFNVSNVIDCTSTFGSCSGLKSIDLTGWNVMTKIKDMSFMFSGCSSLTEIKGLSTLKNTYDLTSTTWLFAGCSSLSSITLNLYTKNCTDMNTMFAGCENLQILTTDTNSFNTNKAVNISHMFRGCKKLTSTYINNCIRNFDTSNSEYFDYMFTECSSATSIDVSNFNTAKSTTFNCMFRYCKNLTSIDVSNFNTSKCENFICMFNECNSLTTIDVSNFDTNNATEAWGMFGECYNLTSVKLGSKCTFKNVKNLYGLFSACMELLSVDISMIDFTKCENLGAFVFGCHKLKSLVFPKTCTYYNVTTLENFLDQGYDIEVLDMSAINNSKITNISHAFLACSGLKTLDISGLDLSSVTSASVAFEGVYCTIKCSCKTKQWLVNNTDEIVLSNRYQDPCFELWDTPDCGDCDEEDNEPIYYNINVKFDSNLNNKTNGFYFNNSDTNQENEINISSEGYYQIPFDRNKIVTYLDPSYATHVTNDYTDREIYLDINYGSKTETVYLGKYNSNRDVADFSIIEIPYNLDSSNTIKSLYIYI